jgi:hypothetical protein
MLLRTLTAAAILLLAPEALAKGPCKRLDHDFDAAGMQRLALEVHVGEFAVEAGDDAKIQLQLEVCPRDGWMDGPESVEKAELDVQQDAGSLHLSVVDDEYKEKWTLRVPAALAVGLEMGIGEAVFKGLKGDIKAELGIGELKVQGAAADYGSVSGQVGVGDFTLRAKGGSSKESRALVSKESQWTGAGPAKIEAEVGIGEAVVGLE